jgi:primosomal protein N' (replication factor Y) (superfamily II helicase)
MRCCKVLPIGLSVGELSYALPDSLIADVGYKVMVPLAGRTTSGLITAIDDDKPDMELKEVISVTSSYPLFNEEVLETSLQADALAFCQTGYHLANYLFQPETPRVVKMVSYTGKKTQLTPKEAKLLEVVRSSDKPIKLNALNGKLGKRSITYSLKRLVSKGVLTVQEEIEYPTATKDRRWRFITTPETGDELRLADASDIYQSKAELSKVTSVSTYRINKLAEQGKLMFAEYEPEKVKEIMKSSGYSVIHMCGNSPERRIVEYKKLHDEIIREDKSMIIVCPNIHACRALASRMNEEGADVQLCVGGLTPKQKARLCLHLKIGSRMTVVGMQQAILLPLVNLAKIIVDEPSSPFSDVSSPHTLSLSSLSRVRAKKSKCDLIFNGSSVTMESMMEEGSYQAGSIDCELVNMSFEPSAFEQPLLSVLTAKAIVSAIENNHKALVYLNRKGFSSFVVCSECNEVVKCPKCQIPLTYSALTHTVRCRYCGYQDTAPDVCPVCGGVEIRFKAGGTERMYIELVKQLPDSKILRADGDTKEYASNIRMFNDGKSGILLGTSMLLDRVNWEDVGLVCIGSLDGILSMPVFSASIKAYSIISLIRKRFEGKMILQTYLPLHPLIKAIAKNQLDEYLYTELNARQEADYPPFTEMLIWQVSSKSETKAKKDAEYVASKLMHLLGEEYVTPPNKGYFHRLKGHFRWDIILKLKKINIVIDDLRSLFWAFRENGIGLEIVNPNQ